LRHSRDRKVDQERGAAARLADDGDVAAALLDDAVDDRQAEAGAFALLLGREERLEQLRARRFVDAVPVSRRSAARTSPVSPRRAPRRGLVQFDFVDAHGDAPPWASRRAR
jgi:hypothetical protein